MTGERSQKDCVERDGSKKSHLSGFSNSKSAVLPIFTFWARAGWLNSWWPLHGRPYPVQMCARAPGLKGYGILMWLGHMPRSTQLSKPRRLSPRSITMSAGSGALPEPQEWPAGQASLRFLSWQLSCTDAAQTKPWKPFSCWEWMFVCMKHPLAGSSTAKKGRLGGPGNG